MRRLAACLAAVLALALAPVAGAHPFFERGFAERGAETALVLVVPNERRAPMTGIELTGPPSVKLAAAESTAEWSGSIDGRRASWLGGHVPFLGNARVVVRLTPTGEPGATAFQLRQQFADERSVSWPMELTVTPGTVADGNGSLVGVTVGAIAIVAALTVGFVVWLRRRPRTLQEK
jgi:hypothetical protein